MTASPADATLQEGPPVSVVIVSRGRAAALQRCLTGVSQLQYRPFEVIVVADRDGITAARRLAFADSLKFVPFNRANISEARNLGIDHAAGDYVAFLDDDAVPEPQWLRYLMEPTQNAEVAALTGFVRGRNGISFQYRARRLDHRGEAHEIEVDPDRPTVLAAPQTGAIKTEGTNMAFRREVLTALGGFDPAFNYFLDETDLNMRLAAAGHATAITPLAEVHHGFAANALRTANRVPRDLFAIGASWAVFHRKHLPVSERDAHWEDLRAAQRRRLLRHMVSGGLEPRDVDRLMQRLDSGYAEGRDRPYGTGALTTVPKTPFKRFPARARASVTIQSRPLRLKRDLAQAARKAEAGYIATVFCLSATALFHRVAFRPAEAIWLQTGGIWGKSDRKTPLFQWVRRSTRLSRERMRVARQRGLGDDEHG